MYGWLGYLCTVFSAVLWSVWTGGLQMCAQAMCCRLVLIVLFLFSVSIMSQASATTATTTTQSVCTGTLSLLMTVTMASTLMGLPLTLGQNDMVLTPLLIPREIRNVVDLTTVPQQQPQSKMHLQPCANYAMGPLQVNFSFRVEDPTKLLICIGVYFGVCFLLSGIMLDAIFLNGGSTIKVCTIAAFWSIPMAGICASW